VHDAPGFLAAEESRCLENPHVLGETRERHREGRGEFAHGGRTRGQAFENPAARRIGERREESIEG